MTINCKSYLSRFDMTGKHALVTGAAGLLGREHALALLEVGANVILTDINQRALESLAEELATENDKKRITTIQMSVADPLEVRDVAERLRKHNTDVDVLINNAAIDPKYSGSFGLKDSSRLENFSLEEWNIQLDVGLTGAFLCSQVFGSAMATRGKGGVILNISSDLSVISPDQRIYRKNGLPDEHQPVKPVTYSVIKSGLIGLTKYLATYWANNHVRCNALSPGGVFTGQANDFINRLSSLIPLGRMAHKSEYRASVQFLCSDASSYMTGQNIVIDGGRSVW